MGWRKHATRAEETQAVKDALRAAGLPFRKVGHGTGTAWSWLEIFMGSDSTHEQRRRAIDTAMEVTGRRGDYDGRIIALAQ